VAEGAVVDHEDSRQSASARSGSVQPRSYLVAPVFFLLTCRICPPSTPHPVPSRFPSPWPLPVPPIPMLILRGVLGLLDTPVKGRRVNSKWAGQPLSDKTIAAATRRQLRKQQKKRLSAPSVYDMERDLWRMRLTSPPCLSLTQAPAPAPAPSTLLTHDVSFDDHESATFDFTAQDTIYADFDDMLSRRQTPSMRRVPTIYRPEERAALLATWDSLLPLLVELYQKFTARSSVALQVPSMCSGELCATSRRRHRVVRVSFLGLSSRCAHSVII